MPPLGCTSNHSSYHPVISGGKKHITASNHVDHFKSPTDETIGQLPPAGRFHALKARRFTSPPKRVFPRKKYPDELKGNLNIFQAPRQPQLLRSRSIIKEYLRSASREPRPSLGKCHVSSGLNNSSIQFDKMFDGERNREAVRGRRRIDTDVNTASRVFATPEQEGTSTPTVREQMRRPSPDTCRSTKRVLCPEVGPVEIQTPHGRRRSQSPVSRSSVADVFAGVGHDAPSRGVRIHPPVFEAPKMEQKVVVNTKRHPVAVPYASTVFAAAAPSGECLYDYKFSAMSFPQSRSLRARSASPNAASVHAASSSNIESPERRGRRAAPPLASVDVQEKHHECPRASTPQPVDRPSEERSRTGRRVAEGHHPNASTLSLVWD